MRTRSFRLLFPAFLACLLVLASLPAMAHRINLFAVVEAGEVVVESRFSRSAPAKGGLVSVFDGQNGRELLSGRTSDAGIFRFAITDPMRESGHGLRIHVNAGEGHENDFILEPSEFAASGHAAVVPSGKDSASTELGNVQGNAQGGSSGGAAGPDVAQKAHAGAQSITVSSEELSAIVEAAVEKQVAPLRRMLQAQVEAGPGISEIVGGIGWILGIFGGVALFAARRRK